MKDGLQKRCVPTTYKQDMSGKMASFSQGSMTVVEHSDKFHSLSSRAKIDEPEYVTMGRHKKGFSKPVRDILHL